MPQPDLTLEHKIIRMQILKYTREHEDAVIAAIEKDPDWDMFTNQKSLPAYKQRLEDSLTYVCYSAAEFCGYVRAITDEPFAVYISELFVVPSYRNKAVGRTLINKVKMDFEYLTVYVLSDEDAYYEKHGYNHVGSVFEIHA